MRANRRNRVCLVQGSDPLKDKDAVGEYTRLLYEHVSKSLTDNGNGTLRLEMALIRPDSLRAWWEAFTRLFERYNLVHIEYPFEGWGRSVAPGFLPAVLKCFPKYRHTKILTTFHEWRSVHPLRKASMLPLAMSSDNVLFVSEQERLAYRASIGRLLARKQGTNVIPVGLTVTLPELGSGEVEAEREGLLNWNDKSVEVLIGFFGFIYAAKQPYKVLAALKTLREQGVQARLVFAGDFPADHVKERQAFSRHVALLGLQDHVLFLGFVDDAILTRVLSACNVVMLLFADGVSARRTSFWTVLELGVPLITTTPSYNEELRELLPGGGLENLTFMDVDAPEEVLADAVRRFTRFRLPLRREGISPNWNRVADEHVTVYREMLEG